MQLKSNKVKIIVLICNHAQNVIYLFQIQISVPNVDTFKIHINMNKIIKYLRFNKCFLKY